MKIQTVLFWLLVWELGSRSLHQEILLVSPFSVIRRFSVLLREREFYISALLSTGRILQGFFLAELFALFLAALSACFRLAAEMLRPPIAAIRAVPVASFIILILVWVPSRKLSASISFLMALPILYEGLLTGIRECDRELLEMAQVFRLSPWEQLKTIWFPAVLPYFRSATVTALGLSWKAGIAAEVIGLPKHSIGEQLYNAKIYLDTADLFAWTLLIVLLSAGLQRLFETMLRRGMERMERLQ